MTEATQAHDCEYCDCTDNKDQACKCWCHVDPDTGRRYGQPPPRIIAVDRDEEDSCERSTPSCCIDHTAERARDFPAKEVGGCDTW